MRGAEPSLAPSARRAGDDPLRVDLFLSYAREDQAFARRLVAALVERGKQVWVDWDDIPPSVDWRARILAAVDASPSFVSVLSPDSVVSEVCREEAARAAESNKRIVPLLHREVDRQDVPAELLAPNWIFFRGDDTFAEAVETLVEALDTDFEWLEGHSRLLVRAREWERERRDPSFLLRGRDLSDAEAWLAQQGSHAEPATPLQVDFILASRKTAIRRQRIVFAAVLAALAVALVLGVVAWLQRNQAIDRERLARSRELAARVQIELPVDPDRGLQFAMQAADLTETVEAERALRNALAASRLTVVLRGNGEKPTGAQFNTNGRLLLVLAEDSPPELWETRRWASLGQLGELRGPDSCAAFSPDGTRVVTVAGVGDDGHAEVWEVPTRRRLADLDAAYLPSCGTFSPDGGFVATVGRDRRLRVWHTATGRLVARPLSPRALDGVSFTSDGAFLVAASSRSVVVWATRGWKRVTAPSPAVLRDAALAQDPRASFLSDGSGTETVVEARTGVVLARRAGLTEMPGAAFSGLAPVSRDGRFAVIKSVGGSVEVWTLPTGNRVATLAGDDAPLGFSRDGALFAAASGSVTHVWAAANWGRIAELRAHPVGVAAAAFSPDSRSLVTVGADGTTRVWALPTVALADLAARDAYEIGFSDREITVLADDRQGRAWYWHARRRGPSLRFTRGRRFPGIEIAASSLSPNGQLAAGLASRSLVKIDGRSTIGGRIVVWDVRTGEVVTRVPGYWDSAEFDAGSRLISTTHAELGRAGLFEARTGRPLGAIDTSAQSAAAAPDGRGLVVVDDENGATIVGLGRRMFVPLTHPGGVWRAAFSGDGRLVATVGYDNTTRVWTAQGARVAVLPGGARGPAPFSRDGKLVVVSANRGGDATIWTVTGELVATLGGHSGVTAATFTESGSVLTLDATPSVRLQECEPCGSLAELRTRAAKRRQFLSSTTP